MYPGRVVPLEIFVARKFGIGFLGGYILVQGIFFFFWGGGGGGGLFEALGIFLDFDYCPHSIIPVTCNLEYPCLWARGCPLTRQEFPLQVYKGLYGKPLNRGVTGWQGALL